MEKRLYFLLQLILSLPFFVLILARQSSGKGVTLGTSGADLKTEKLHLIELNEDNWRAMLKGEWMVEFFAPWCPACRNLAPTWERFASSASNFDVNVAKLDVTTSPSLSGRFFVTALPTIYHVKDGEFRQYRGSREWEALMIFIKQNQWKKIEPISAWKKPDTIHMSILSYFFKLSHTLKDFNSRLQEKYGLPTWGSYALFAMGTIFVGAVLGLMLVCVVDLLYPPKKSQRRNFAESKETVCTTVEDIANDEIEDDAVAQEEENNGGCQDVDDDDNDENENDGENENENEAICDESESVARTSDETEITKTEANKVDENSKSETEKLGEKSSPGDLRKRKVRKDY